MALKLKYTDEHGILHINMSPSSTPKHEEDTKDITDPKFDTINNRFGQYDLFSGKYDVQLGELSGGDEHTSLFRSRYNSIEEELANTPYAFTSERSSRNLDITIKPRSDIEDDRYFRNFDNDLFGPQIDVKIDDAPAFTVKQLIHAQDRFYDLSSRANLTHRDLTGPRSKLDSGGKKFVQSAPSSAKRDRVVKIVDRNDGAFKVLPEKVVKAVQSVELTAHTSPVVPTAKRKRERSFAILVETPPISRPSSPRSLPVESRSGRVSPFRGRGFREETSLHTTPRTSAVNSRSNSPRRRTCSLSRIDKMAAATLPPPLHTLTRPHSPRNFVKENIEEIRELSELNRELHEAEAEQKRLEEEEALLKEMGLLDKNAKLGSRNGSRVTSRSNSPSKINLRSRSNSPSAILHFENIQEDSKAFANVESKKPVQHKSRVRSLSRSQPQSNGGSPTHSKIPKRQGSISPNRTGSNWGNKGLKSQRFISNSTSSINEGVRFSSVGNTKKPISKSTQLLSISPAHIKSKPPIPGKVGPPPSNRSINSKRLSPIVGTPSKSPVDDLKPGSARTPRPSPLAKKPNKTAGNTPTVSRLTSRQPSTRVSRDPSPEKRKATLPKTTPRPPATKPVSRTLSNRLNQKPPVTNKTEVKKPMNRTSSIKSLNRAPSTKNLNQKPTSLKKTDSKKDLKESQSTSKLNELVEKKDDMKEQKMETKETKRDSSDNKKSKDKPSTENKPLEKSVVATTEDAATQDTQTQYDNGITNEKGDLVILSKKSIVSMTTAAITAQPLEVVTTVTNQLPAALEKAREKGMFERLSSKDLLVPKEGTGQDKVDQKDITEDKQADDKKTGKTKEPARSMFTEDNVKLKPLQPPYNNPHLDKVKQKIDDILKAPEVSSENILSPLAAEVAETKSAFRKAATKTKNDLKESKIDITNKFTEMKDQAMKQTQNAAEDIRSEATKIVDSIITPVEEPKELKMPKKEEVKANIEPIVMVVNEKRTNGPNFVGSLSKQDEKLLRGEASSEAQSSNLSTPHKMESRNKMAEGNGSVKSMHSNGGFSSSAANTPQPPARHHRPQTKEEDKKSPSKLPTTETDKDKKPNICSRLITKCAKKTACCSRCVKPEDDEGKIEIAKQEVTEKAPELEEKKEGFMRKFTCCKKKDAVVEEAAAKEIEKAAGKVSIDFENEAPPKRSFKNLLCFRCGRRVSDSSSRLRADEVFGEEPTNCWGKRKQQRRDSILSDRPPPTACNRMLQWMSGACRSKQPVSRRPSVFSKNKSLSPTLPPEDTRPKLDATLIEHTSAMRGAIPVLPLALAYFCLVCNIIVPGLGTIFSGMFCLCFGIPRFGVHDGAKYRIGAFVLNLFVGCGQLFTVLFCLVGWGWSIWWGTIMVRVARKYRKLRAEMRMEEEQQAPPVTANNHTTA